MRIYSFELKNSYKSVTLWTALITGALLLFLLILYPYFMEGKADFEAVLNSFPPEFAAAFGMGANDLFSLDGFYSFGALYLGLCGGFMSTILGLSVFSREKRSRCTEFLLTKPVTRNKVFLEKLLAVFSLLILSNLIYTAVLSVLYSRDGSFHGRVLLAGLGLFLLEVFFLSISVITAILLRRVRSVSAISMAIVFGAFVFAALQGILEEEFLLYLNPFKYFDAGTVLKTGSFPSPYALFAVLLSLVLLIAAYFLYTKRDVKTEV